MNQKELLVVRDELKEKYEDWEKGLE